MTLNELDFQLRKLFIVTRGLESTIGQTEFDDLFFVLLDEIKQLQDVYEKNAQELMNHI